MHYEWGYHSSDSQYVHVARVKGERREDLFDVTLYDREEVDPNTGRNCEEQSLVDLKELLDHANAALRAGSEHAERAARLRTQDKLDRAVEGLRRIANPNWAAQATGRDARDMAGYAGNVLTDLDVERDTSDVNRWLIELAEHFEAQAIDASQDGDVQLASKYEADARAVREYLAAVDDSPRMHDVKTGEVTPITIERARQAWDVS